MFSWGNKEQGRRRERVAEVAGVLIEVRTREGDLTEKLTLESKPGES